MVSVIDCPACKRKLRLPEELLGQKVQCPSCGMAFEARLFDVPLLSRTEAAIPPNPSKGDPPPASRLPAQDEVESESPRPGVRLPCPFCGEPIRANAVICRFCGEDINDGEGIESDTAFNYRRPRRDCEPHRGSLI